MPVPGAAASIAVLAAVSDHLVELAAEVGSLGTVRVEPRAQLGHSGDDTPCLWRGIVNPDAFHSAETGARVSALTRDGRSES